MNSVHILSSQTPVQSDCPRTFCFTCSSAPLFATTNLPIFCLTKRWVYCNWFCPFSTDRFVEEGVVQGPSRNACLISSCSNYFKPYQCPNSIYSTLKLQTYSIDIAVAPLNSTHPLYTQWHIFKLQNLIAPVIMCLYTCAVYIAHLRKAHNPLHAHAHIIKHQTTIRMHTSCQCQHA